MAKTHSEDRDITRFDHFSPLHVHDLKSGKLHEARMVNYSNRGIYFESDGLFQKDTKIYISMQNSPYAQSSDVLEYISGEVKWRKSLKQSLFKYGYGIELVVVSSKKGLETNDTQVKELRRHSRKPYFQNILCKSSKELHTGRAKNISPSGVFIATKENLSVGQQLKLSLPQKKGKSVLIMGQIVWLNEEGFGFKFQKIK